MAENYSELENKENSLEQVLKLAGLPSKFKLRAEEFNTVRAKLNDLKFLIDSLVLNSGGISGIRIVEYPFTSLSEITSFASYINNLNSLTVEPGRIVKFKFTIIDLNNNTTTTKVFSIRGQQEGIYGVGGSRILQDNDMLLDFERITTADELEQAQGTQVVTFPNLSGSIEDWLTSQDPPITLQIQSAGLVIFRGTILNEPTSYLFVGPRGNYGVGAQEALAEYFEPLKETNDGITVDSAFSETSINPVQNKVITEFIRNFIKITNITQIPNRSYYSLQNFPWELFKENPYNLKVPTEAEWTSEFNSWSTQDSAGAFGSPLKLTLGGLRYGSSGFLYHVGIDGYYWSSTVSSTKSRSLFFDSSGAFMITFDRTNGNSVRLIVDGTFTQTQFNNDYLNETVEIDGFTYGFVYNPTTSKVWLDRNLGATQMATSVTDANAYGDLFQWGRSADGHEKRTSSTTTIQATTPYPDHGNFVIGFANWLTPSNDNLWQGVTGINNPAFIEKLIGVDCKKASYLDLKDLPVAIVKETNEIDFRGENQFGTPATPRTGNITYSNVNAQLGKIQKMYHDNTVEPTYPATFFKYRGGDYLVNAASLGLVNVIFVEWVSITRQEYWIVQIAI